MTIMLFKQEFFLPQFEQVQPVSFSLSKNFLIQSCKVFRTTFLEIGTEICRKSSNTLEECLQSLQYIELLRRPENNADMGDKSMFNTSSCKHCKKTVRNSIISMGKTLCVMLPYYYQILTHLL